MEPTLLSINTFRDIQRLGLTNIFNILISFMKDELEEGNVIEIETADGSGKEIIRTMEELRAFKKRFQ